MQRQNPHIWCRKCYELRNTLPVSVVKDIKVWLEGKTILRKDFMNVLEQFGSLTYPYKLILNNLAYSKYSSNLQNAY